MVSCVSVGYDCGQVESVRGMVLRGVIWRGRWGEALSGEECYRHVEAGKEFSMDDKIKALQVVNDYIKFDRASSNVTAAWETVLRYIKSLEKSVK